MAPLMSALVVHAHKKPRAGSGATNINLMPPEIGAEYAEHDYHPRFRDVKAGIVGMVFMTVLVYPLGGIVYRLVGRAQNKKRSAVHDCCGKS